MEHCRDKTSLKIVDLGAGTGANCIYFAERLTTSQKWILIEQDSKLCREAHQRISTHFQQNGWSCVEDDARVFARKGGRQVHVEIINQSFFDLESIITPQKVDLVMAAAVFDLLQEEEFRQLANAIFNCAPALFTTMNYTTMKFIPEAENDDYYIRLYEAHMQRNGGMGADCTQQMHDVFLEMDLQIELGKSQWQLVPTASRMHYFLLGFMEEAIGEMLENSATEQAALKNWLATKRNHPALSVEVNHFDLLVRKV